MPAALFRPSGPDELFRLNDGTVWSPMPSHACMAMVVHACGCGLRETRPGCFVQPSMFFLAYVAFRPKRSLLVHHFDHVMTTYCHHGLFLFRECRVGCLSPEKKHRQGGPCPEGYSESCYTNV